MTLSGGEKLILAMLAGIYKKLEIKHDIDPNVILAGVRSDSAWILQLQYGGSQEELPPKVKETCDILDMYRLIESSFEKLSKSEKERVTKESDPSGAYVKFQGFDGNHDDHYGILSDLVNVLEKYQERKGGILDSHSQIQLHKYRKMLSVFQPIIEPSYPLDGLTADQLITVLKGVKT
jgi:uncharacterized protein YfbU (UPF0304 family)